MRRWGLLRTEDRLSSAGLSGPDLAVRNHPAGLSHAERSIGLRGQDGNDTARHDPQVVLSIERFIGIIEHYAGAFPSG